MQVFKKFSLLFMCLGLFACSTTSSLSTGGSDASSTDISELNLGNGNDNFRVGVILPLSGEASRFGKGLKNATMLALEDTKNPKMVLQFYDTKSTDSGARTAIENALNQQAKVIIGPLKSSSVRAISDAAKSRNVPVIAFSTSEEVLQPEIYTLGLLIDEQVNRIVTYAVQQGRSRLALLLPDNATGIAVARAAAKAARQNNIRITRIAFYPPNTSDFSEILKKMTDYGTRQVRTQGLMANLKARAAQGDEEAAANLRQLSSRGAIGGVDFDMVLIPESGAKLKSAVAMFGYYDVFSPEVKFLGTSIWENSKLNNETTIVGGWYPALSRNHSNYFANKYAYVYGEKPNSLYSLAYDAVALSNALANNEGGNLTETITNTDGYVGINGVFRLFENGYNQHSLDIMEVRKSGDVAVDSAPKRFDNNDYAAKVIDNSSDGNFEMPIIIGKDSGVVQSLIFSKPSVAQESYYPIFETE